MQEPSQTSAVQKDEQVIEKNLGGKAAAQALLQELNQEAAAKDHGILLEHEEMMQEHEQMIQEHEEMMLESRRGATKQSTPELTTDSKEPTAILSQKQLAQQSKNSALATNPPVLKVVPVEKPLAK